MNQRLVMEFYGITDEEMRKLADNNAYWRKAHDFWWQVRERDVTTLTQKQCEWLSTIEDELSVRWRPRWMQEEGVEERF